MYVQCLSCGKYFSDVIPLETEQLCSKLIVDEIKICFGLDTCIELEKV